MRLFYVALLLVVFMISIVIRAQDEQEAPHLYVTAVAWSHDGRRIATVGIMPVGESYRGYIRIIDAQTQNVLYAYNPFPGGFSSVAWSADDHFIALGSYDQVVHVIDTQSYVVVAALYGHRSTITDVDWNHDGTKLVSTGSWDGLTLLWDMTTYQQIHIVEEGSAFPASAAFSPDGQRIAMVGEGGLRIYSMNAKTGEISGRYLRQRVINALAWSKDGSYIAAGSRTYKSALSPNEPTTELFIVNADTGAVLKQWQTEDWVTADIAWGQNNGFIATVSGENTVKIWDTSSGTLIESFAETAPGLLEYPRHISLSPYGGRLVYGGTLPVDSVETLLQGESQAMSSSTNSPMYIVVPSPSLALLDSIVAACIPTNPPTALPTTETLATYIEAVKADSSLPPACAADLIAVAEALQAEPSSPD